MEHLTNHTDAIGDPYLRERQTLITAVTAGRGSLAPDVRRAIVDRACGRSDGAMIPGPLATFVDRVSRDATAVGDADVDTLVGCGFDEEAVFEAVVAAALGASLVRLERVDELLGESD
jgi:hypothetical protein